MTRRAATVARGAATVARGAATVARGAATVARGAAVDGHLARVHLRLGSLLLARAELEALAAADALDVDGFADLAEARWRTDDLAGAGAAAAAHAAAGGGSVIATVISAEAAASTGRSADAQRHAASLAGLSSSELEALLAGMPMRAFWPSAPAPSAPAPSSPRPSASTADLSGGASGAGILDGASAEDGRPDAPGLVAIARESLRSADGEVVRSGLARLALALRLDPGLASAVVEVLARQREPSALIIRGDAFRLLGRTLDAEAAYAAAAAILDPESTRSGR